MKAPVRKALGLALASTMALGLSAPAKAVSFNGSWGVDHLGGAGGPTSHVATMSSSTSTFCYLSRVRLAETDTASETVDCRLAKGSANWFMYATLGSPADDAWVHCEAICYNN